MNDYPAKHMTREEAAKEVYERAFGYERDYGNCCQCTVASVAELFGLDTSLVKSGHLFSAGFGSCGRGTCGALSGAALVLSTLYGRERSEFPTFTGDGGRSVLIGIQKKYEETFGSIVCHDVQRKVMGRPYNLLDPEDRQRFLDAGGHVDKCTHVVGMTAMWLAEAVWDHLQQTD